MRRRREEEGVSAAELFDEVMQQGTSESEQQFVDSLNRVIKAVELSDEYSDNKKLKIYECISQITNCMPNERARYARRLSRMLK